MLGPKNRKSQLTMSDSFQDLAKHLTRVLRLDQKPESTQRAQNVLPMRRKHEEKDTLSAKAQVIIDHQQGSDPTKVESYEGNNWDKIFFETEGYDGNWPDPALSTYSDIIIIIAIQYDHHSFEA